MISTQRMPKWLTEAWRRGIGFRLALLVVLILLPFAALWPLIYHQRYENRRDIVLRTEMEAAQGVAASFAAYIEGIQKQNLSLGHAIQILAAANNGDVIRLLVTTASHSVSVQNISWVSRDGVILASSAPGKGGVDLSQLPLFKKLAAGQEMALGDLVAQGAVSQEASFALATAIRDEKGRFEGAVVAEIEPATVYRILPHRPSADSTLSLFDSQGNNVYHSGVEVGKWLQHGPMVSRVLQSRRPEVGIRKGTPGDPNSPYVSAVVPVPPLKWLAAASCSMKIALTDVRRGVMLDSLLGSGVFALAFLLAYLLGRNIVAPIRRLENDARLMGQNKPVPQLDPFAPREVASLRETMLSMAADLIKRADELRESEELMRSVFENVYDGILIHTPDGRILDVNRRWLQMVMVDREEAVKMTISDLSPQPPPMEELLALWKEVLTGKTKLFEWRGLRGDGGEFDAEVFLCPIRFRGQERIMACVRDITERKRVAEELRQYREELELKVQKRTEELARAVEEIRKETAQRIASGEELRRKEQLLIHQSRLAAMGEMMGNIAHQWRQPLNLLALIIQELKLSYQKGSFSEELLVTAVTKAMTVISHMSQTIDDFRNLLSPDKMKTSFTGREVLEKVLSMLQLQAEVTVVAEDDCPMEGSRNEFSQVLINILSNARDVLKERQVEKPAITIRLFREDGRSVVTIADNGGGIAPEIMDKIFDPYYTTKGPDKGTGLGLFMSKTIIEQSMNGCLTVRNTGEGAEFRIAV